MFLLPSWLQQLFKKKGDADDRAFASEVDVPELVALDTQPAEQWELEEQEENQANEKTTSQEFEIFPEDQAVRKKWFALSIRERQVVALVCMGHRNYEIAD